MQTYHPIGGTCGRSLAGARSAPGPTMAGLEHFKGVSVDYRMPPEAYFPATIDEVLTVYKALQRTTDPKNMAIFGTSAGGAILMAIRCMVSEARPKPVRQERRGT
jgi:epsilon-lactone hydrolase